MNDELDTILTMLDSFKQRLDAMDSTMNNYHSLLTNHITDFSVKFGRLRASIETEIKVTKARDEALHLKIDAYKWVLILIATLTVASLGGFISLAIQLISRLP